ncbi:MAG: hypothetical protein CM1200mP29_04100 [Verrucomicrobiota bacterium]|nr:MAG: hypothetical protein CM1200mP29_04100 [Verrucomicrobiota bacterium]
MRFVDIAQAHSKKQPGLAKRLVAHKNFPTGSHLTFALTLKGEVPKSQPRAILLQHSQTNHSLGPRLDQPARYAPG